MTAIPGILRGSEIRLHALENPRHFSSRYLSEGISRTDTFAWYGEADKVVLGDKSSGTRTFSGLFVPPGWGKTRGYTVLESVRRIASSRSHRIGLFSKSKAKAENYMVAIKSVLESNKILIQDCGPFLDNSTVANTSKIIVIGHPPGETTPSIVNLGMSSQVESLRFNTMIIDDPLDRESAFSETEVEHFISRMKNTFIPRLEPGGQMIIIGSRFGIHDGYDWIINNPLFKENTFILPALDERGNSTCPERFSREDLLKIRDGLSRTADGDMVQSSGDWEARFMQNPKSGSELAFKLDWINPETHPEKWIDEVPESIHIGIDPAYSSSREADYTGGVAVGVLGSNPVLYDIMALRISSGFRENIIRFKQRNNGVRVLVEVNNARTLGDEIRKAGTPCKDIVQATGKVLRIGDTEQYFRWSRENGGLLFHRRLLDLPEWQTFLKEYLYFPDARHEHILDSLEFTLKAIKKGGSGFADPGALFN